MIIFQTRCWLPILRHYELKYFYENSLSIYNNRIKLRLDITFVVTQGFKDLLLTEIDFLSFAF